ncbi:hypothetical protein GCM10007978_41700 [Shewanella hanedai]|nr:hypothetical protein GCM10007978_41700 [Shewanella hanedai]
MVGRKPANYQANLMNPIKEIVEINQDTLNGVKDARLVRFSCSSMSDFDTAATISSNHIPPCHLYVNCVHLIYEMYICRINYI